MTFLPWLGRASQTTSKIWLALIRVNLDILQKIINRHLVIKAAVNKWKKMCQAEDDGDRPVHHPRDFKRKDRKLAKVIKKTSWHQRKDEVSAPLILDPVVGDMVQKMKAECQKFESLHGERVALIQRAGKSVRTDAKSEPLRTLGCAFLVGNLAIKKERLIVRETQLDIE